VVVASDLPDSEKCRWAREQPDLTLKCVGDRAPGQRRKKSLYFYENIGISAATGDWILITNDDTEIMAGVQEGLLRQGGHSDVLVVPAEIDNPSLGKRAPVIGQITKNGQAKDLYLLDFAFIRTDLLIAIGPADESFDWYGAGADRSILISLIDGTRVDVLAIGSLTHHLEIENRTPPHFHPDFEHLRSKWRKYSKENPGVSITIYGEPKNRLIPLWWFRSIWPLLYWIKRKVTAKRL
jgi:hypothetical protein